MNILNQSRFLNYISEKSLKMQTCVWQTGNQSFISFQKPSLWGKKSGIWWSKPWDCSVACQMVAAGIVLGVGLCNDSLGLPDTSPVASFGRRTILSGIQLQRNILRWENAKSPRGLVFTTIYGTSSHSFRAVKQIVTEQKSEKMHRSFLRPWTLWFCTSTLPITNWLRLLVNLTSN